MPYGALRLLRGKEIDRLSPLGHTTTTPQSDIAIATPSAGAPSPNDVHSPTSTALNMKKAVDRAHLFISGRHQDLIRSMGTEERQTMSTWLYQFWFFSFKTAKHWGRGPRDWTAETLNFGTYQETVQISLPSTPSIMMNGNSEQRDHSEPSPLNASASHIPPIPSQMCRWVIHLTLENAKAGVENYVSSPQESHIPDPQDETTWTGWPKAWHRPQFHEKLRNGLENNDFSSIGTESLPIAVPQVVKAAKRSPDELLQEAFGFSIIGCNLDLISNLLDEIEFSSINVSGLYPLHMAATYLDGSRTCCDILNLLLTRVDAVLGAAGGNISELYINDLGHTVLDSLMVTILKSHTSVTPGVVDDELRGEKRFIAEDIDICGRWDADSDCIRARLAEGKSTIPLSWKHKFCHTSAQSICHSITMLLDFLPSTTTSSPSGLFIKHCLNCGLKMQLQPVHTLVMTAFHLVISGCEDEDLFGILACLLSLVFSGVDVSLTADLSLMLLLGREVPSNVCSHKKTSPADLAHGIAPYFPVPPPPKADVGWRLFCHILRQCEQINAMERMYRYTLYDQDCILNDFDDCEFEKGRILDEHSCIDENRFGGNRTLAILWASVQAELATYRRLDQGLAWLSDNINLEALLESLELGLEPAIRLMEEGLIKPFCLCGQFYCEDINRPTVQEVSRRYFANLDVWGRATYRVLG